MGNHNNLMSPTFAMIGCGYIAPRHLEAIKGVGGVLRAVCDSRENVGFLNKYFPRARFFNTVEEMETYLSKQSIDYVVVCSPNHLHQSHIKAGLRIAKSVICEKPLTTNSKSFSDLYNTDGNIFPMLQLRADSKVREFGELVNTKKPESIKIVYHTFRGDWYNKSWKMNQEKSGGLIYNIGIHLVDLLCCMLGEMDNVIITKSSDRELSFKGFWDGVCVDCELSINDGVLEPMRLIRTSDGDELEFSDNFTSLHSTVYERILKNDWITVKDIKPTHDSADKIQKAITEEKEIPLETPKKIFDVPYWEKVSIYE